eukprot:Colp12_sorted_trinity150504_noHs@18985
MADRPEERRPSDQKVKKVEFADYTLPSKRGSDASVQYDKIEYLPKNIYKELREDIDHLHNEVRELRGIVQDVAQTQANQVAEIWKVLALMQLDQTIKQKQQTQSVLQLSQSIGQLSAHASLQNLNTASSQLVDTEVKLIEKEVTHVESQKDESSEAQVHDENQAENDEGEPNDLYENCPAVVKTAATQMG